MFHLDFELDLVKLIQIHLLKLPTTTEKSKALKKMGRHAFLS